MAGQHGVGGRQGQVERDVVRYPATPNTIPQPVSRLNPRSTMTPVAFAGDLGIAGDKIKRRLQAILILLGLSDAKGQRVGLSGERDPARWCQTGRGPPRDVFSSSASTILQ